MPAEWSQHSHTWMLWPQRPDNWRLQARPAQLAFAQVAKAIAAHEPVIVGANPAILPSVSTELQQDATVISIQNNDAWIRDCGPTFVINGRGDLRIVNWQFNAWGGLYANWELDEMIPKHIAHLEGLNFYKAPMILEGGSIHVDGEGTLLTTKECLLNPNRNPHLNQNEIEKYLCDFSGAIKILWLEAGLFNDETSGHVDNIACFLRPGVVALAWTDDHNDPQYPRSLDAYERLLYDHDAKGRKLEVLKIHQPNPQFISADEAQGVTHVDGTYPRRAGDRLAASYVNFYFCNGGVIVPVFQDPNDKSALKKIQDALPDRVVHPVFSREILLGGGNIHCITQQQPTGYVS